MLEAHQTPSKLAHAYVETLKKSIKLIKTKPKPQTKHQNHSQNSPARKFLPPGGGTKRPPSLRSSGGQKTIKKKKIILQKYNLNRSVAVSPMLSNCFHKFFNPRK
jgi:hypothetical protein